MEGQNSWEQFYIFLAFQRADRQEFCPLIKGHQNRRRDQIEDKSRQSFFFCLHFYSTSWFSILMLSIASNISLPVTDVSTTALPVFFIRTNLICPLSIFLSDLVAVKISSAERPLIFRGRPKSFSCSATLSYSSRVIHPLSIEI